jgi:hypothetical protein
MALDLNPDIIMSIAAIILSGVVIYLFIRATGGFHRSTESNDSRIRTRNNKVSRTRSKKTSLNVSSYNDLIKSAQVTEARSTIRTLTLKQEIFSMVMKRLFEAEDEGEISKGEREQLAKDYEDEMKQIEDSLNQAELIISLNELEEIRRNVIKQYETTLNDTRQKIDLIVKELNIEPPKPPEPEPKPEPRQVQRRRRQRPKPIEPEDEETEEEGDEEKERSRRRESVDDRLDKLKKDVLKELDELDRLELEA